MQGPSTGPQFDHALIISNSGLMITYKTICCLASIISAVIITNTAGEYTQATNLNGFSICRGGAASQQCWYISMTDRGRVDLLITCCSFMIELLNGFRMLMSCNDTKNKRKQIIGMILHLTGMHM